MMTPADPDDDAAGIRGGDPVGDVLAPSTPGAASMLLIGTATMLLSFGGLTVLTDPNFLHKGQRAYLGHGLTSKRLTEPALTVDQLPPLDAIVLSHLHGDHWDRVGQRGLDKAVPILTTSHAARRLRLRRFRNARGLATWATAEITSGGTTLRVTALPGRHARGPLRHLLPPVMGSLLEFGALGQPPELRIYITGDTLLIDDLREIPRRFPHLDVAVLHLGGTTLPGGMMVTMDATQGADLLQLVAAGTNVPIHYDDYPLFRSPLADFRAEIERRGLLDRVTFVGRGETVTLSPTASPG